VKDETPPAVEESTWESSELHDKSSAPKINNEDVNSFIFMMTKLYNNPEKRAAPSVNFHQYGRVEIKSRIRKTLFSDFSKCGHA
jgi:hypothetical protein